MAERVGIYGGSFNPIHFGHLNLALEMLEKRHLTKVLFCPAAMSPFKTEDPPISAKHRLAMVKLAIAGIPQFSVIENELQRAAPSYTIDTVEELLKQFQEVKLHLVLGEDLVAGLPKWHKIHELLGLVTLLVGSRTTDSTPIVDDPIIQKAVAEGLTQTRTLEISSSELRDRIGKKYCGHLLPTKVLDYIIANHVY